MISNPQLKIENRTKRIVTSDDLVYNFKSSGIGDSWLIGTENLNNANAFKNGVTDCPYNLTVPSTLTDEYGQTKKVEIIGQFAFSACADQDYNGETRILTLTKQVKVIKFLGLGYMDNLEEFVLEEGSVLETIESHGLDRIGYYPGYTESKRVTLTLPSTLSSVFKDGICECNLFNVVIYCGSHPLTNTTDLKSSIPDDTVVKVSSEYPSGQKIFGYEPDRNSEDEVEKMCNLMHEYKFMTAPLGSENGVMIIGFGNTNVTRCPGNFSIPEQVDSLPVLAVNESAFENCTTSGAIVLPQTLKRIGARAFARTERVTGIFFPGSDSLEEIGEFAFWRCGANASESFRFTLPFNENLTIQKGAFLEANIGNLIII